MTSKKNILEQLKTELGKTEATSRERKRALRLAERSIESGETANLAQLAEVTRPAVEAALRQWNRSNPPRHSGKMEGLPNHSIQQAADLIVRLIKSDQFETAYFHLTQLNHATQQKVMDELASRGVISEKDGWLTMLSRTIEAQLISSENKGEGWKKFQTALPELIHSKKPTSEELPYLHKLTTDRAKTVDNPEVKSATLQHLCFNDNTDTSPLESTLREELGKSGKGYEEITALIERVNLPFEIEPDYNIQGQIRTIGHRVYPSGDREEVFGSHSLPFNNGIFLGLTKNLRGLYNKLCDKFDEMWEEAQDNKEKLLAILYLQIIGTRFLHPFWDGNGRTFSGHFVLSLNRMGIPVTETPTQKVLDAHRGTDDFFLSSITDQFLVEKLGHFIQPREEILKLSNNSEKRNRYMSELHDVIEDVIDKGFVGTDLEPYILLCYHYTRYWLHKEGHWDYTENGTTISVDQSHMPPEHLNMMIQKMQQGTLTPHDFDWSRFKI